MSKLSFTLCHYKLEREERLSISVHFGGGGGCSWGKCWGFFPSLFFPALCLEERQNPSAIKRGSPGHYYAWLLPFHLSQGFFFRLLRLPLLLFPFFFFSLSLDPHLNSLQDTQVYHHQSTMTPQLPTMDTMTRRRYKKEQQRHQQPSQMRPLSRALSCQFQHVLNGQKERLMNGPLSPARKGEREMKQMQCVLFTIQLQLQLHSFSPALVTLARSFSPLRSPLFRLSG